MELSKIEVEIAEAQAQPLDGLVIKPHFISQSEADAFLNCKRKHYYAFGEPCADGSKGIQPIRHSEALSRGTMGHEGMAAAYQEIKDGGSYTKAKAAAVARIGKLMLESGDIAMGSQLISLVSNYFDYYAVDDVREWEVLAVEHEFRYEMPEHNMVFPFRPDVIMRSRFTGKVYIWDHKFVYNWYDARSLEIMPQLVKYTHALRLMGFEVEGGLYNQLSTRKNSRNPFNREPLPVTAIKGEAFWEEQVATMLQIVEQKDRNPLVWKNTALRTASSFNCKNCPFLDICVSDLEKRNGRALLLSNFYAPNKYGYGKEIEAGE